jgi:hypothetical protein
MDVVSTCPIRVSELRWLLPNGAPALTVVCKATFPLQPGDAALAPHQEAPAADEAYWSPDPDRSPQSFSDLVPFKPRADVVIVGHAYAPPQRQTRSILVRAIVGTMDRSVEIHPERVPLPNGEARESFPLAGLGPVPPGWPARVYKLYRHGRSFLTRDWNTRPLPEDIDQTFFNAAPPDQQLAELRADARVMLDHLHPDHARLVMRLPGVEPTATVQRPGRGPAPLPLTCDTLWIDSDRGTCSLVWRGMIQLAHAGEPGQVQIGMAGAPASMATPAAGPPVRQTVHFDGLTPQEALPFSPRTGAHALRDLSSSVITSAPPAAAFAPPPRPSAPGSSAGGMPPRAMTVDIPSPVQATPPPPPPAAAAPPAAAPPAPPAPARPAPPRPAPPPLAPAPASLAPPLPAAVQRPPQGSIGERLALEQASADAKPPLDRRGSDEPERIGPLARPQPSAADPPAGAPREPALKRAPASAPREAPRDALVLLWLDPSAVPRMRKKPAFREILDALEEQEPDEELDASIDGALADVDDQRAVFEILAKAQPTDEEALQKRMIEGLREDGKLVPPLMLLAGELAFPFDELATLRATVITAAPLAGADEQLKAALENARELLKTPDLACSPAVAEGMTQRIRDAFAQGKRVVPPGYLEAQTERTLLDQRACQRRTVFGGAHLRALLHLPGASAPVPAYLPAQTASKLPLYQRFRVRIVASGHVTEDQNETHPTALRVLALARVAPAPGTAPAPPPRK